MPVSRGDVLTGRRGVKPAKVRVLGVETGGFVVEAADDGYSAPYALTPAKLAADYGGDPSLPPDEEAMLRQADAAATEAAAAGLFRRVPARPPNISPGHREQSAYLGRSDRSPEEIFDAAADAADE